MKAALRSFGYRVGVQSVAEEIFDRDYFRGDFTALIDYCRSADAFQDVPFSLPSTYEVLDAAFPGSQFILTVRSTSEDWYASLCRFHSRLYGREGRLPTLADLEAADYRRAGFMTNLVKIYGTSVDDPYHKETLIAHYEAHNAAVRGYFHGRDNLLEIDVSIADDWSRLAAFLGRTSRLSGFPHENRSP